MRISSGGCAVRFVKRHTYNVTVTSCATATVQDNPQETPANPNRTRTNRIGLIFFDLILSLSYISTVMKRLLTSCFGLGWLPIAPGTWGSLPTAAVFTLMCYFDMPAALISIIMVFLALAGCVICIKFAPAVIEATGKADPQEVVVDEFAGQAITFLVISFSDIDTFSNRQILATAALGFFLFRLFDIVKIWPISLIQKLPKGWGILADDLLAGVYAAIVLLICVKLWIIGPKV